MPTLKKDINPRGNPKKVYGEKGQKVEIMTSYTGPDGSFHCVRLINQPEKPPFDVNAKDLI